MQEHDEGRAGEISRVQEETGSNEEVRNKEEEARLLEEVSSYFGIDKKLLEEQDISSTAVQIKILNGFANKLIGNMQSIPQEYARIINTHFWELVDDGVRDKVEKRIEERRRQLKKKRRRLCRLKRKKKIKKRLKQQRKKH